jgi:hypothetical protein
LNVNAIIVNNTDFSVNVSDNWAYLDSNNPLGKTFGSNNPLANIFGGGPWIAAIPNEFSKLLVNTSQEFSAKAVQNGGAYSVFAIDTGYPYRNVPLEIYTEYANNLSRAKIFSRENTTIGGEQAIRIHRIPLDNTPNVEVVAYYSVHKGKPYWINYVANEKDFQKYLPQFEQMVRTFKFVN